MSDGGLQLFAWQGGSKEGAVDKVCEAMLAIARVGGILGLTPGEMTTACTMIIKHIVEYEEFTQERKESLMTSVTAMVCGKELPEHQ